MKPLNEANFLLGFLLVAAVAVCLSAGVSSKLDDHQPLDGKGVELQAEIHFRLPQMFNFDKFKNLFKKHYPSLVEEMVRKKIFLARAFRSFITAIRYKYREMAFYLSINFMSDWTEDDVNRSKINARNMADPDDMVEGDGNETLQDSTTTTITEAPMATLDDIERELNEIERRKNEPAYSELATELEALKLQAERRKREVSRDADGGGQPATRTLRLDQLMRSPVGEESPEVRKKMLRGRVPGNNPDYEPPELVSYGTSGDVAGEEFGLKDLANNFFYHLGYNPVTNFVAKVVEDTFKPKPSAEELEHEKKLRRAVLARHVLPSVDHRDSKCMLKPRSQGNCGSCYAFTAVALYEWLYCNRTGNVIGMSEQYMVDCGHRAELNGCSGGNLARTAQFVGKYGLELAMNYPYRAKFDQCPYDDNTDPVKMGYLKLEGHDYKKIKIDYVHEYIDSGPMMMGLKLGPNFRHYGGGIDDNADCREDDAHGMLLVGSGYEDGKGYWIFRNSHSIAWGEGGYYRLAQERLYDCSFYEYAIMASGSLDESHKLKEKRTDYLDGPIKERYNEYIMSSSKS